MNELKIFSGAELSSVHSSVKNAALRRAYMQGFRDAAAESSNRETASISVGALAFGFLCWVALMFFVFK